MKALNRSSLVVITGLVAIVGIAYAAQPPNVVVSDLSENTAMGTEALLNLTSGTSNTAAGFGALFSNTTGDVNTAFGNYALFSNSTGFQNTATGYYALQNNTTGESNTAAGYAALTLNTTGYGNTAIGGGALFTNTTGIFNTATGSAALGLNTVGDANTASGSDALGSNTSGRNNVAVGRLASAGNTTGINNIALGHGALYSNATGFRNVALGYQAGYLVTGSDNIIIGGDNQGQAGVNGVIRIGKGATQKKTLIAGIRGVTTGLAAAIPVFIDANGQLGTIKSSGRYKEDIRPMGGVSERLLALRPVTFRYKQPDEDGSKPVQFGLVAEEVAQAFPELAIYDADGKPETVAYHLLAILLLNEFQKAHSLTRAQMTRITELEEQAEELVQLREQVAMMAEVVERLDHERMVATTR